MALFKIYKGKEADLPTVYHEGYAYFTTDEGNLYIDIAASADFSTGTRIRVNAGAAETAKALDNGATHIEISDILLKSSIIDVAHGGTGQQTLALNAILVGNGTGAIKVIPTAGGAFFATSTNGAPNFGVLPKEWGGTGNAIGEAASAAKLKTARDLQVNLASTAVGKFDGSGNAEIGIKNTLGLTNGGTGAANAATARSNLEVYGKSETYTKEETNNQAKKSAAKRYNISIPANGWSGSGPYTYNYTNASLTCGLAGDVCPSIVPEIGTNLTEYSKIDTAIATAKSGVVFTATSKPTVALSLILIDHAQ